MRVSWRIIILIIGVLGVLITHRCAGMQGSYSQGAALAQQFSPPPPSDPSGIVPEYQGAHVPQARYSAHDLDAVSIGTPQVTTNEAGRFVVQSSQERERFTIDPKTDPIIRQANDIVINPQQALNENITPHNVSGPSKEETHVCEESGEETLETGEEYRVVTVRDTRHVVYIQAYSHGWSGGLSRNVVTGAKLDGSTQATRDYSAYTVLSNPLPYHLQGRVKIIKVAPGYSLPAYVSLSDNVLSIRTSAGGDWFFIPSFTIGIEIIYAPGPQDITDTTHATNCEHLEERVDQGLCSYEDLIVLEGPQTRVINGHSVTRDWWRRKRVYRCHYPCKDNCGPLRAKGCYQSKSICKQKVGETCVVWEQTYKCPAGQMGGRSYRSSNLSNPFCLSGNCVSQLYDANGDFASVMAQLSVIKKAHKDMRKNLPIFKGEDKRCTRDCLGFRNCCGSGKGWGVSVKFASCGAEEKKLAKLREKGRCIRVGSYCTQKVLGQCVSKETSFCCYENKLAKLIQEQGRSQLGLGFGCPKEPRCEGLTIEQLAQLDFSKINFSEVFGKIIEKTKIPQGQKLTQDIQQTMSDRASLMNVKEGGGQLPTNKESLVKTNAVQGRGHDQF